MNWSDAQNWLDILDHLLIGVVAILVAAIPSYFAHRNSKGIQKIQDQVVNGHKSPMRSDLDKAISAIESLANDITALRRDLADEEERRYRNINELREEVDWKFNALNRRIG